MRTLRTTGLQNVIPAKAGIQSGAPYESPADWIPLRRNDESARGLDSRLRGNDVLHVFHLETGIPFPMPPAGQAWAGRTARALYAAAPLLRLFSFGRAPENAPRADLGR